MPDDRIVRGIANLLEILGYAEVEYNVDTLWFKDNGRAFSISVVELEGGYDEDNRQ